MPPQQLADRWRRLGAAVAIGAVATAFFLVTTRTVAFGGATDFEFWWRATRLWLSGVDPYRMAPNTPQWPLPDRLYYPMPTLLLTIPFVPFTMRVAGALFVAVSSAGLAWALTRSGMWRLWVLATPAFVMAVRLGQWSPILTAAALIPAAGFLLSSKPTLGLAAFTYAPTWRGAIGVVGILAVSVLALPSWPIEWLANLQSVHSHPAPIATPFGWILLVAVLRWRQPEARLLLAMACIPQLLFFADQLVLGLVARTKKEAQIYAACGLVSAFAWLIQETPNDPNLTGRAAPYVMLGCYLPALLIVLRRPNEGPALECVAKPAA